MDYLSFIPCGIPASSRLVYRPVYPQVVTPNTFDTHDGVDERKRDEEFAKRDEEIRQARLKLRADLLSAVERVTGRPPSLDASPKELASIARKSESFDYRGALEQISRIEAEAKSIAREREEAQDGAKRRKRRQEEEALMLLLLQ